MKTDAPVNVAGFNRRAALGRRNAEQHIPALERAYARTIRQLARESAASFVSLTAAATPTPNWQPPPAGNILNLSAISAVALDRIGRIHKRVVKDVQEPALARIGISFDISHPLTADLLAKAGARGGEAIDAAVQPVLVKAVAQGYADGLSVDDTAKLIQADISDAADWQAKMLARTDLNSLSNGGSVAAARQAGLPYKTWLTAGDEKVREDHANADGQTMPVDQPFAIGGESLDYPGDPAGSDSETINCRCTVIYSDSLTASGGGAMKGLGAAVARASAGAKAGRGALAAAVTITVDGPAEEQPETAPVGWVSDLAFEGAATEDGRYILPGALGWRDLPLTLMAMTVTSEGGHEGAFVAGRIDEIAKEKRDAGKTAITARGVFDSAGADGAEVARLVADETVRGVSVDLAINDYAFRDPATGEIIEPNEMDDADMEAAMFGELQMAVRDATIMAATVCPTPAFADARIAVTASGQRVLRIVAPFELVAAPLTASAAGMAPAIPPETWFYRKEADRPTPLTVSDDGQVFGHIAAWDSCHTGKTGVCVQPPRSPSGYAYFNTGEVRCANGKRVGCGQIFFHAEHAPLTLAGRRVLDHYAHTGLVGADVRAVDGRFGIWVSGALRSTLTVEEARAFMGAKPSGDWRQMTPGGALELIGVLAVNEPGFPVPRQLVASAEDVDGEAVALTAAFDLPDDPAVDRRLRVLAARAEGGIDALADLAGV